jgi:hypothetical protein
MDIATAQSFLSKLISCLPKHHWWPLLPNEQSPTAMATVFGRPQYEIEDLLVAAGVYKYNMRWKKVTLHKAGWDLFCNTLNADTKPGDCFRAPYVTVGEPTYPNPEMQIAARVRLPVKVMLPEEMLSKLRMIADTQEIDTQCNKIADETTPRPSKKQKIASEVPAVDSNSISTNIIPQSADKRSTLISYATPVVQSKRLPRKDRRQHAVAFLTPAADLDVLSKKGWQNQELVLGTTQANDDKNDLRAMIEGCYDKNVKRAAAAIVAVLSDKRHIQLREEVCSALQIKANEESDEISKAVLEGIRLTFAHLKSTKTRQHKAEVMVKNVAAACVFNIVQQENKQFSNVALTKFLGLSKHQLKLARRNVLDMIANDKHGLTLERKKRSDFIRDKLALYVYDYLKDYDVTRLDTNMGPVEGVDPRTGLVVSEHMRIWNEVNKDQRRMNFLDSTYYHEFRQENDGASAVSYGVWKDALSRVGWFVSDPTQRSCVDEKISGFEHVNRALGEVLKRNRIKTVLEAQQSQNGLSYQQTCIVVNQKSAFAMVDAVCCEKEERPDIHIDKDKPVPRFIPFLCTHGGANGSKCSCCGIKKKLSILEPLRNLSAESEEDKVDVKVWKNMPRQGFNSKGEQNTQRELSSERWTIEKLVNEFERMLEICITHCQEIRWIRHIQQTDFSRLPKNTILIFTDFAASMALRAAETKNSSADAHAVNDNFVVVYNKRSVTLETNKIRSGIVELEEADRVPLTIWTCDVHHFFAETMSKGKKNDHAMHNTSLDALIKHYIPVFESIGTSLEVAIIWSDNAPYQYRCRQNFMKIATVEERHPGIKFIHRLAVVDQFKGNHDAVGKDPARLIRSLELSGIRSENGRMVFKNCHRLEKRGEDSEWLELERRKDIRLKRKGKYGMDSRTVWFVVETEEEYNELHAQYPGKILRCDRTFILDAQGKAAMPESTKLHEIRSVATAVPSGFHRVWPVHLSYLPCNCTSCIVDDVYYPLNNDCRMRLWRNTIVHNAKIGGVPHDEAMTFVGKSVRIEVKKEKLLKVGEIIHYVRPMKQDEQQAWIAKFEEVEEKLSFSQVCKAMKLFQEAQ